MSGGGGGAKDEMGMVFILGGMVVAVLLWIIWICFHVQILDGIRWVKFGELSLFSPFSRNAAGAADTLRVFPAQSLTVPLVLAACSVSTVFIRWPCVVLLLAFALYRWKKSPQIQYRRKFNLESLIKEQAKMWPVIKPITYFMPGKTSARIPGEEVPAHLPLFAESLSPEEWISWARIPIINGQADREAIRRAFLRQLGPRWSGLKCLSTPAQRALFAAFALKGAQKRSESDDLLSEIASNWTPTGGLNLPAELRGRIDKLIADPKIGGAALEIAKNYGWRTTALIGILKWAREQGGVLAPAQFLWLRGSERTLWYPLNNLGRKSYHAEAAGAMAHYMAESNAKRALLIPRVDTALVTINQYLNDIHPVIPPLVDNGGAKPSSTLAIRKS